MATDIVVQRLKMLQESTVRATHILSTGGSDDDALPHATAIVTHQNAISNYVSVLENTIANVSLLGAVVSENGDQELAETILRILEPAILALADLAEKT